MKLEALVGILIFSLWSWKSAFADDFACLRLSVQSSISQSGRLISKLPIVAPVGEQGRKMVYQPLEEQIAAMRGKIDGIKTKMFNSYEAKAKQEFDEFTRSGVKPRWINGEKEDSKAFDDPYKEFQYQRWLEVRNAVKAADKGEVNEKIPADIRMGVELIVELRSNIKLLESYYDKARYGDYRSW